MKRKGKGKRCVDGSRAAGRADAMAKIERWQAEASGDVAERLAGLALAVAGEDHAAPQQLRQDW